MALLGLRGGATATLWVSWTLPSPGFPQSGFSARVVGDKGMLDLDAYGVLRLGRDGKWETIAEQAPIDFKGKGMLDPVRLEAYARQGTEFLNSIREGRHPSVTGEDGRAAVQVALAAYQAADEHRIVKLDDTVMRTAAGTLALHGGERAVYDPLPRFLESAGRTFGPEEEALVLEVLRSGCLSKNGGTMVKRLEGEFASRLGVAHAVACSSGSAAVHLAVAALDPEPGDEFIVPPITDLGTVVPVLWQNCVPVFADVDPLTMTLDPADVARKITPRTRAIIAVHLAGQPCDMRQLRALVDQHKIVLIEDCAQAYLGRVRWPSSGNIRRHGLFQPAAE